MEARRTPVSKARVLLAGLAALSFGFVPTVGASQRVGIPLICSNGPSDQKQTVLVTAPVSAVEGSTYVVRVDGTNSGKISHFGLNYIFDMSSEWLVPAGTQYVEASARIIPNTGSENVRAGARIVYTASVVNMVLPAHVNDGSNYTPPSFEFELKVTASPGATVTQAFSRYRVTANAFLVGNVQTTCDPNPRPFPIATTKVERAAQKKE